MKRNSVLSIRSPEATNISRALLFNQSINKIKGIATVKIKEIGNEKRTEKGKGNEKSITKWQELRN